jgi:hypothetical protein
VPLKIGDVLVPVSGGKTYPKLQYKDYKGELKESNVDYEQKYLDFINKPSQGQKCMIGEFIMHGEKAVAIPLHKPQE